MAAPSSAAVAASRSGSRAAMATSQPSSESTRAMALPMPRLPPVTSARLPASCRSIGSCWPNATGAATAREHRRGVGYRPLPRRVHGVGARPERGGLTIDLFLQRCIDGLANGSLYGALALALVIVYKASGRLNLAQGEQATLGTYFSLVLSSPVTPALAGTALAATWLPGTPWPLGVAIAGGDGALGDPGGADRAADRPPHPRNDRRARRSA